MNINIQENLQPPGKNRTEEKNASLSVCLHLGTCIIAQSWLLQALINMIQEELRSEDKNKSVGGWMSEWLGGWVSDWVGGWVNEWVIGWVSEWMSEWEAEWLGFGCLNG